MVFIKVIGLIVLVLAALIFAINKYHVKPNSQKHSLRNKYAYMHNPMPPPMKPRIRHIYKTLEAVNQDLQNDPERAAASIKTRLAHCISEIDKVITGMSDDGRIRD